MREIGIQHTTCTITRKTHIICTYDLRYVQYVIFEKLSLRKIILKLLAYVFAYVSGGASYVFAYVFLYVQHLSAVCCCCFARCIPATCWLLLISCTRSQKMVPPDSWQLLFLFAYVCLRFSKCFGGGSFPRLWTQHYSCGCGCGCDCCSGCGCDWVAKHTKTIQNQYDNICSQHMLFLAYVSAYVSGGASYVFPYVFL